jgi:hypothetical protein
VQERRLLQPHRPGSPPGRSSALCISHSESARLCVALLYGRAGRLTAKNGGSRRGQCPAGTDCKSNPGAFVFSCTCGAQTAPHRPILHCTKRCSHGRPRCGVGISGMKSICAGAWSGGRCSRTRRRLKGRYAACAVSRRNRVRHLPDPGSLFVPSNQRWASSAMHAKSTSTSASRARAKTVRVGWGGGGGDRGCPRIL